MLALTAFILFQPVHLVKLLNSSPAKVQSRLKALHATMYSINKDAQFDILIGWSKQGKEVRSFTFK